MTSNRRQNLLVGTYTSIQGSQGEQSKGVYLLEFLISDGQEAQPSLAITGLLEGIANPSWICPDPIKPRFWVASEAPKSQENPQGQIAWCTMAPGGTMNLGGISDSGGADPCHLSLSPNRANLFAANYSGGNTARFAVAPDGTLSQLQVFPHRNDPSRPLGLEPFEKPHGHCVQSSPDGRWLWTADLGINSIIRQDLQNPDKSAIDQAHYLSCPGTFGPRHFVLNKAGTKAWLVHEHQPFVDAYTIDTTTGNWKLVQRCLSLGSEHQEQGGVNLENNHFPSPGGAAIKLNATETMLYLSNRGKHNSISSFSIHPEDGRLSFLGTCPSGGKSPRDISISPDGNFLLAAHQESSTIVVHRLDPKTGIPLGQVLSFAIPLPVCLVFVPPTWNMEAPN